MERFCKKHGVAMFAFREGGSRVRCKKCAVESVQKRRLKIKKMAVDYKGGNCQKCGYDKCIDALEFHHLDPSKKEFSPSTKGHCKSWDSIKNELDKCLLVCSNCHREIHSLKTG